MNKSTKIEAAYIGSKLTNLPKYAMLAGLIFSSLAPFQNTSVSADVVSERPALLALADIQSLSATANQTSDEKPIMLTAYNGSTLANQANPFAMTENENKQADVIVKTNKRSSPVIQSQNIIDVKKGVIVTAYSSTPDQTDDSPFITAMGSRVHDGIIACNFLKFGTKVKFPEMYGDKVFVVEDRMAKRHSNKADIWMETREQALQFGARHLTMEIVK